MKGSHNAIQEGKVLLEGGIMLVSGEQTKISPKETLSTTPGRSIALEPREVEPSTTPNSPFTNMHYYGHKVAIIISPRSPSRGLHDRGKKVA
jgi:hypothetical protein